MKNLAQLYLRYWSQSSAGLWDLASNAHPELARFVADAARADTDRQMIHQSLTLLAAGKAVPVEPPAGLDVGRWFAAHPAAARHCDVMLKAGRAPKSFSELIQKAYLTELREVRDRVQAFLAQQIREFESANK